MRCVPHRRPLLHVMACLALAPLAWPLAAQTYPDNPITLVVPYPAGAAVDRVGRALAVELGRRLGQPVVVENVAGASGTLGGKRVQRAPADGYTLLLGTVNDVLVGPVVLKAGYSVKDFTPIAKLSVNSTVLVAHPSFPANSVDELAGWAQRQKEPVLAGATGSAMMQTVGGSLLAQAAGFRIEHVPYKGGAPLLNDLVGGQVKLGTIALTSALPMIREGKLKALGVISAQRDPTAPQVPTVNEGQSVKGVSADLWTGLLGPAQLPASVQTRLYAAVRDVLLDPAYRDTEFKAGSVVVDPAEPARFAAALRQEEARLQPLLSTLKAD